jgi:plastocyanin
MRTTNQYGALGASAAIYDGDMMISMTIPRIAVASSAVVIVAAGILALYVFGRGAGGGTGTPQQSASVVLTEQGFMPQEVTIKKGGTVTFTTNNGKPFWPASDPHPSHSIYPEFDPRAPIAADSTWSFSFDKVGNWGYHDHLRSYYTGTIHVVE